MHAMALFLSLILASAAVHKLVAVNRLAAATARLLRVSLPIGRTLSLAAAAVELGAALALLVNSLRPTGALLAAALWASYAFALLDARIRGETAFDCGCSFGTKTHNIDRFAVFRAFGLTGLAISLALIPVSGPPSGEAVFAAFAFLSLYAAAGEIAALPSLRRSPTR